MHLYCIFKPISEKNKNIFHSVDKEKFHHHYNNAKQSRDCLLPQEVFFNFSKLQANNIVVSAGGDGEIQEISFLGGLRHGYRRVKQAA